MKVPHLCGIEFSYYIIWRFNLKAKGQHTSSSLFTKDFEKIAAEPALKSEKPIFSLESVKHSLDEKSTEKYDFVEQPSHYNGHTITVKGGDEFNYETIEFIESWLRRHAWMPEEAKYAFGNALKYFDRIGDKPEEGKTREEKAIEDSEKLCWYVNRATKALKGHSELYKGN